MVSQGEIPTLRGQVENPVTSKTPAGLHWQPALLGSMARVGISLHHKQETKMGSTYRQPRPPKGSAGPHYPAPDIQLRLSCLWTERSQIPT